MYIGTTAWTIPKVFSSSFPSEGSHLQRYARVFKAVEINSSFYREHLAKSYLRWAEEVPDEFRFSVKLGRAFLHDCSLRANTRELQNSLERIMHLGEKLGVILLQLPASLAFDPSDAESLFKIIRKYYLGPLALEPRNKSWASKDSQQLMIEYGLSKVMADPERCPCDRMKILSSGGVTYFRLHGHPVIYQSAYSTQFLEELSRRMQNYKNAWCIFDNTTFGFATENALTLQRMLPRA